ncbi:hypothetical protein EVAR_24248_1 [Eumeta japonica]|uniref:Uncharacterized protein n=1 Tax=Eumeta variegata TaxID=151549 RepID=A0A4C1VFQ1_EUMVA|nr:hypothetical protein EVAR_24248_1 [Eumeta japonica]
MQQRKLLLYVRILFAVKLATSARLRVKRHLDDDRGQARVYSRLREYDGTHCDVCVTLLTSWAKGSRHMPFAVPMIWAEPKDHVSDCYFCQTSIKGINHKSRNSVNYPNLQSAQRPIPHSDNLPVPQRPVNMDDVTEESVSEKKIPKHQ